MSATARLKRRKKRLDPAQLRLPLIALIDVVLFLLMYFMIAGTLSSEEKALNTAIGVDRNGTGAANALLPTIITVQFKDGRTNYLLGERLIYDQQALTQLLMQLPKDGGAIIKAARGTTVGDVASALQACRDAKFTKISFVSTMAEK